MNNFQKGEIWWFDPDPVKGREQGKKVRPCVIVSGDHFNNGMSGLLIVIPCTTKDRGIISHISLDPRSCKIKKKCFAMPEQLRCVDKSRLKKGPIGMLGSKEIDLVEHWIMNILDIEEIK